MTRTIELGEKGQLEISEYSTLDDEAGAVVWDSALVLIHYLLHCREQGHCLVEGKSVIELGCGTGAVGLAAAVLGAEEVVLTDLPKIIPHVEINIQGNQLTNKVSAIALDWGSIGHIKNLAKARKQSENVGKITFDVVLAADVVYKMDDADLLLDTISLVSRNGGNGDGGPSLVLLAYERREGTEDFFDMMGTHGLSAQRVPSSELHPEWQAPDIEIYKITKLVS